MSHRVHSSQETGLLASVRRDCGYLLSASRQLANTLSLKDLRDSVQPVYQQARSSSKASTLRLATSASVQLIREKSLRSTKSSFFRTTATEGFTRTQASAFQIDRSRLLLGFQTDSLRLSRQPLPQAATLSSAKASRDRSAAPGSQQQPAEPRAASPSQSAKKQGRPGKEPVQEIHPQMLGEPLVHENKLLVKHPTLPDDRRRPPLDPEAAPKRQATDLAPGDRPRIRLASPSNPADSSRTSRNSPETNRKPVSGFRLFEVRTRRARKYQVKLELEADRPDPRLDGLERPSAGRLPRDPSLQPAGQAEESEAAFELCGKVHRALRELYAMHPTKQERQRLAQLLSDFIFEDVHKHSLLRDVLLAGQGSRLRPLDEVQDYHLFQYLVPDAASRLLHDLNGTQSFTDASRRLQPQTPAFQFLELVHPAARSKQPAEGFSLHFVKLKKVAAYPVDAARLREVSTFHSRLLAHVLELKRERNKAAAGAMRDSLEKIGRFRQLASTQGSKQVRSIKVAVVKVTNPLAEDALLRQLAASIGPHRDLLTKLRDFEEKHHHPVSLDEQYLRINRSACETMQQLHLALSK